MQEEQKDVIHEEGTPDTPIEAPSFQRRLAAIVLTAIGVQLLYLVGKECLEILLHKQALILFEGKLSSGVLMMEYRQFLEADSARYYPLIALLVLEGAILIAATHYGCSLLSRIPNGTTRLRAAVYIITIYLVALALLYDFYESITVETCWIETATIGNEIHKASSTGYRRVWSWIPVIVGVIAPTWAWFLLRRRRVAVDKNG
jgi:hypothetical protein